jgi:hypothetical protein
MKLPPALTHAALAHPALEPARRLLRRAFPPREITVIGHSHSWCVGEAAQAQGFVLNHIDLWKSVQPIVEEGGEDRLHPAIAARIEGRVFSLAGGGYHLALSALQAERRFDFLVPGEAGDLAPGAEIIPYDAARQAMAAYIRLFVRMLALFAKAGRGRAYHVQSPPPPGDDARMAADLTTPVMTIQLTDIVPRSVRLKLWRLHSQIMREECARLGVGFIACPREAIDDDGFLRAAYYLDPVHVNAAYGALVLKQIRQTA